MRRITNRVATSLFALLLAASLTFGVASAFARETPKECPNDPPTWLGACFNEEECDQRCIGQGGFDGECSQFPDGKKCCVCAL